MAGKMEPDSRLFRNGDSLPLRPSAYDAKTLAAGDEITVFSEQVPDDKVSWWGHGGSNRLQGNTKHIYQSLVASGNGAGTAGDAIVGELVVVITDSKGRDVKARRTVGDLGTLADAESEARTDRPTFEALAPVARPGRQIQVRIRAAAESDGVEIDPAASSGLLHYTEA